jgi:hypothetical protein
MCLNHDACTGVCRVTAVGNRSARSGLVGDL